jgi:hypothetical protein
MTKQLKAGQVWYEPPYGFRPGRGTLKQSECYYYVVLETPRTWADEDRFVRLLTQEGTVVIWTISAIRQYLTLFQDI